MSVNTGAKQFRKVDVDQLDEERYVEDSAEDSSVSGPNEAEVNSLLAQYPCMQNYIVSRCTAKILIMIWAYDW